MGLALTRQQRLDGRIDTGVDVGCAVITGVSEQLGGPTKVRGQRAEGFEPWRELLLVVGPPSASVSEYAPCQLIEDRHSHHFGGLKLPNPAAWLEHASLELKAAQQAQRIIWEFSGRAQVIVDKTVPHGRGFSGCSG